MTCFLGVDTSNYTTSVALTDADGRVILNLKKLLPVGDGERGLRQSDALFQHTKQLPGLTSQIRGYKIAAVGVSAFPRDAEGSYMPCFLAGKAAATAAASAADVPLYAFSHQRGHIRAALYSARREDLIGKSYLAFHVSGGTTEMLLVDRGAIELIGGTLDLNAGQAIDRVGVALGLRFPCGAEFSRLAASGTLPELPKISVNGAHCNLSGLENKALKLISSGASANDVAAYTIEFVKLTLDKLCENLRNEYGDIPIVCAGGVCSNADIADRLGRKYGAAFAAPEFSSDNAAGVSLLARDKFLKEGENG